MEMPSASQVNIEESQLARWAARSDPDEIVKVNTARTYLMDQTGR